MHVVCRWLGNSLDVAIDHYLQMTDAHLRGQLGRARKSGTESGTARGDIRRNGSDEHNAQQR